MKIWGLCLMLGSIWFRGRFAASAALGLCGVLLTAPGHADSVVSGGSGADVIDLSAETGTDRQLADLVGRETLSGTDQHYLSYESAFERTFLDQGRAESRSLDTTLDLAWQVLTELPRRELTMLPLALIREHLRSAADSQGQAT